MLKGEILKKLGLDLPISGGFGMYPEDAIIIHAGSDMDLQTIEQTVHNYLYTKYCKSHRIICKEIIRDEVCVYERYFVCCDYKDTVPSHIDLTYLYFDITDCQGQPEGGN